MPETNDRPEALMPRTFTQDNIPTGDKWLL
jgi:hypothetical protein